MTNTNCSCECHNSGAVSCTKCKDNHEEHGCKCCS